MKSWLVALSFLALGGCISTSEMQLSKNVFQVDVAAGGALFVGGANDAAMKRAAELTLAQGYSHFVIANPNSQSSSTYVGSTPGYATTNLSGTATANLNVVGNTAYGSTAYNGVGTTTYTPGIPIIRREKNVSMTVIMYNAS